MMPLSRVLLIDDEPTLLFALKSSFGHAGWHAETACTLAEGVHLLRTQNFDLIVCDVRLGAENGFNLLPYARAQSRAALLFLTAHATVPDAVRAIHGGAFDYLTKPVSFEHLLRVATRIISDHENPARCVLPQPATDTACNPALFPVPEHAWRSLAAGEETVLLVGASGVGKRTFAQFLHRQSRRRHGPFLTVECGSGDALQLSRELFGDPGTGFGTSHPIEAAACVAAHGGTLVLHHAELLPPAVQHSLSHVITMGAVAHAGLLEPVPADIRVIACAQTSPASAPTSDSLSPESSVLAKVPGLRTVLFPARLPGLESQTLPPSDSLKAASLARSVASFMPWPANATTAQAQSSLAESAVRPHHQGSPVEGKTMQELERLHLEKTLEQVQGNRTHAAELLGISVRTMRNKIRQYDLAPRRYA